MVVAFKRREGIDRNRIVDLCHEYRYNIVIGYFSVSMQESR